MRYIALHHTANKTLQPQLGITNDWHKQKWNSAGTTGWYVGYNFFCERDGVRTNTRPIGTETIANKGHNCDVKSRCDTISYCMAGDFRYQEPTERQTEDLRQFVLTQRQYYPNIKVIGHRDIGSTSCPALPQKYIDQFNETAPGQATPEELQNTLDKLRKILYNLLSKLQKQSAK